MVKGLIALFIILAAVAGTAHALDAKDAYSTNGGGIYAYDEKNAPEIFFFPPEKARWDGYKVTMREWYMLTDLQKEKFISEYTEELKRQYKAAFDVVLGDYLSALDAFSYYSNEKAAGEPSTKFIEKMLRGQGKL